AQVNTQEIDQGAEQETDFLSQIRAAEGWEVGHSSKDITIAILDTGVDLEHPALVDNLVPGANMVDESGSADDDSESGHGTQVAGVLAANGEDPAAVRGVLRQANIMPVKVLDASGRGSGYATGEGIYY